MSFSIFSILLALSSIFAAANGQQLTFTNCKQYFEINPQNYSRDFSSQHPLGYNSTSIPYMDGVTVKSNPCITLTSIPTGAYIEVKAEALTAGARICVGDDKTMRVCGNGQLVRCYSAPSTMTKFEFYCDTACEQSDVTFWYRFVTSEANPSDQWCENRISDDYPSSLLVAPTNIVTASTKGPIGKTLKFTPSAILVCLSSILMLITLRLF